MKSISTLISLLFFVFGLNAQQPKEITVYEKKEGDKNIVIARNSGKVPYLVTLNIHATGMDVTPGLKAEAVVPPGYMKELATLTPQPGAAWTYGYDVSYIQSSTTSTPTGVAPSFSTTANTNIDATKAKSTTSESSANDNTIVIYTKPGCSRCAFVKKGLTDKGIKFKEVDVTNASPEVNDMWMNLRHGGFNGESVTMPVVKLNGQLHYNIKDLQKFVSEIQG